MFLIIVPALQSLFLRSEAAPEPPPPVPQGEPQT
jgi:hypothetical protein